MKNEYIGEVVRKNEAERRNVPIGNGGRKVVINDHMRGEEYTGSGLSVI